MMRINRITGLVLNWSPVEMSGLHVDSLVMKSRYIIDAAGHKSALFGRAEELTSQNPFIPS